MQRRPRAPVGNVRDEGIGLLFEQLAGQMMRRARTRRAVVEAARLAAHLRQKSFEIARNILRVDHQHLRHIGHQCQRHKVFFNVVVELWIHRRRNRMVDCAHEKRVAIGLRLGGNAGAQCATRTAPVVDDELFTGQLGKLRRQRPGKGIGAATSRKGHDHRHRLDRPGRLRMTAQGNGGHAGSGKLQQAAATAAVFKLKGHLVS